MQRPHSLHLSSFSSPGRASASARLCVKPPLSQPSTAAPRPPRPSPSAFILHPSSFILFFLLLLSLPAARLHAQDENKQSISASDQMKYDVTSIDAKLGQKLTITLTNDGSMPKAAMAHNLCILKPGTDPAAVAAAAKNAVAGDYIPADQAAKIIVHTKLLGPGDADTISFTPHVAGTYEYICTFPAHLEAGMRGTITVK